MGAPLAIAVVPYGVNKLPEAYDEGRVTKSVLIGAPLLGLGDGIGWFGDGA